MTETSTNITDNGSDNGQSDKATTRLDPEDNQQTLQQESVTELTTVVPISIQEDFLWDLCDNAGKYTFSRWNFCDGMRNSWCHYNGFVYHPAINSLSSTLWNSVSLTCVQVNRVHYTTHI